MASLRRGMAKIRDLSARWRFSALDAVLMISIRDESGAYCLRTGAGDRRRFSGCWHAGTRVGVDDAATRFDDARHSTRHDNTHYFRRARDILRHWQGGHAHDHTSTYPQSFCGGVAPLRAHRRRRACEFQRTHGKSAESAFSFKKQVVEFRIAFSSGKMLIVMMLRFIF